MKEKDYNEFVSLVKQMRKAQKNYYKDRPKVGCKVAYNNMINIKNMIFKKGSMINGKLVDQMTDEEKASLLERFQAKGCMVIIEGYNDNKSNG